MPWLCPLVLYALMEGMWIKQTNQGEVTPILLNVTSIFTSFECKVWTPENWKIRRWRNVMNQTIESKIANILHSQHNWLESECFLSRSGIIKSRTWGV